MSTNMEKIVSTWLACGFEDLYVAETKLNGYGRHSFFFFQQALEKIAKAYIIGKRSGEFKNLSLEKAREFTNEIGMECGHGNYLKAVDKISGGVFKQELSSKRFPIPKPTNRHQTITGWDLALKFEDLFKESRYPVPFPHHKSSTFKIGGMESIPIFVEI